MKVLQVCHRDSPPFPGGPAALEDAIATVTRLGALEPQLAVTGQGGVIENVAAAARAALDRLALWREEPARMALHGCRRVFGFALVIHGGFERSALMPYLLGRRWVHDFGPLAGPAPVAFAERMVADLLGSGAARWESERLVSAVPHTPLTPTPAR